MLSDDLEAHLKTFNTAPFLFIGSGISRRYLGLEDWEGLLRRFAEPTGKPYAQYRADADGYFPGIASRIAEDFGPVWWADDAYAESRDAFEEDATRRDSPLKIEISRHMASSVDGLDENGEHADELQLLRRVEVDGIITTNYDPLLERLFPGFVPYVGQNDVIFSETQAIGEIYQIHGSCSRPNSLVLTTSDYQDFNERNAYLAAKLLTIFVDHPVVFLGYSMQDENILTILDSIARGLTTAHLRKLQDRLIFIEWDADAVDPVLTTATFAIQGSAIPVRHAKVATYSAVYEALGRVQRGISARLLRQLRQRVFELVQTTDPVGSLKVVDIDAETETDDIDVVFGVGAVQQFDSLGLVGLRREALIDDVLDGGNSYPAEGVVRETLPAILPRRGATPVFKYLRAAGLLNDDGTLKDRDAVDARVAERVEDPTHVFQPPPSYRDRASVSARTAGDFATLVATNDPATVFMAVALLPDDGQDPEALRNYIVNQRETQFDPGVQPYATQWGKAVCLYDWLKYGRVT